MEKFNVWFVGTGAIVESIDDDRISIDLSSRVDFRVEPMTAGQPEAFEVGHQ